MSRATRLARISRTNLPIYIRPRSSRSAGHGSLPSIAVLTLTLVAAGAFAETAPKSAPRGEQAFIEYCAVCHGESGIGDGPFAAALRVPPSNLRLLSKANDGVFPDRKVQRAIDGRGMPRAHGTAEMPIWGREWKRGDARLREVDVTVRAITISTYLRSIQE